MQLPYGGLSISFVKMEMVSLGKENLYGTRDWTLALSDSLEKCLLYQWAAPPDQKRKKKAYFPNKYYLGGLVTVLHFELFI